MGIGHVRVVGAAWSMVGLRSDGRTVSEIFPVTFPATFFVDRFAPNFKFSRLCGLVLVLPVF